MIMFNKFGLANWVHIQLSFVILFVFLHVISFIPTSYMRYAYEILQLKKDHLGFLSRPQTKGRTQR